MEPFAANLLTQQKNPRKRPVDRSNEPQRNEAQNVNNEQNLFKKSKIDELESNLAKKSQNSYSYSANSKIILQQSIESLYDIKKFLLDLENQNMKPDVKIVEIHDVIEDLSKIEASMGEPIIKEIYMCPPEQMDNILANSEIEKEPVNLMEKPNSSFVETKSIELEVEGESFMVQTSIEPSDFHYESENIDIVKSEQDPIEIKERKISDQDVDDLSKNPWKVYNLQEFLRFLCPECNFLSKDENEFHSHAIKNHDQAKEIWDKGVESENISEQHKEMGEADVYQKSKTHLKNKDSAIFDIVPNMRMVEATKILEKSFNTKNIDVPTSDQDRDIVQNLDIDFDSLEVQSILENIDTLCGYDDFRDDFDRYPINTSLDSFQWMKKYSYVAERMQKFRTDRELKLLSNVPLIRKVNHVSEDKSDDKFENIKKRNKRKLIVKICDKTKKFKCPIEGCYSKYELIGSLQNHIRNHPKLKVKVQKEKQEMTTVQCNQCGWKSNPTITEFANLKLDRHLFYHHFSHFNSNHTSDFMCDICGMKFFDQGDLEKHKTQLHGEEKVCETCGETFKASVDLKKHMQAHKASKLMECELCGKQIKGATRLKVHKKRAHQNESLRTCHICAKVLYNRCELYKHYMNDHSQSENPVQIDGKYVFQCEYCNKILCSIAAHYTHIKLVHKMKKTSSEIKVTKKQKCPFCTEENLSSRDYVIHLVNEHPDKEPPNDLKRLERGFNCTDCNEIYYSPMFYYRHLKYNHEKIVYVPAVRSKKFMEGV